MGHIRQRHLAIIRAIIFPLLFVRVDQITGGALALVNLSNIPGAVTDGLLWIGILGH